MRKDVHVSTITAIPAFRRQLAATFGVLAALAAALVAALGGAASDEITLSAPPPAADSARAGASPALERLAASDPDRRVTAIVQLRPRTAPAGVVALVRRAGGTRVRTVELIGAIAARLSARDALALASEPGVRAVSLDAGIRRTGRVFRAGMASAQGETSDFTGTVRAPWAWRRGIDGQGVGVAIVDTGIAGDLPDFRRRGRSRVVASAVVNPDAESSGDGFGHGTHIAGLVGAAGEHPGVAPAANLISVKADDGHGGATVLDVIEGLQFVVDHRDDYGIRVVNLSLRSDVPESYRTDPLDAAVEAAWNAGIVVVTAAGNEGTATDAVGYAPANDPFVITVGATDDQGTAGAGDDELASWSSRGTTQDGFAKPEVVAPGAHMVSTLAPGADYADLCPTCVIDGRYFRVGGTSMAAGVVSGAVAAIVQAHPDWTPDEIKATLMARSRAAAGGAEVALDRVLARPRPEAPANAGVEPNDFIDPATGGIDYERASWSRASWSRASWSRASWSRASWSRASWTRASWSRASWSRASWSRASWSRASWSRASWSARFGE